MHQLLRRGLLSGTYCHKIGTRPPSCATPRQPTIYLYCFSASYRRKVDIEKMIQFLNNKLCLVKNELFVLLPSHWSKPYYQLLCFFTPLTLKALLLSFSWFLPFQSDNSQPMTCVFCGVCRSFKSLVSQIPSSATIGSPVTLKVQRSSLKTNLGSYIVLRPVTLSSVFLYTQPFLSTQPSMYNLSTRKKYYWLNYWHTIK